MNGLHILAGIIVAVFLLGVYVMFDMHNSSVKCENKGGVYVYKIHRCMKKEYFISLD